MTGFNEVDVSEMQTMARRQLAGSIVVGVLVLAVASLIGLRSTHSPAPITTAHSGVQQPVFVSPSAHMVASTKQRIETP
jgi:hypothetical protein